MRGETLVVPFHLADPAPAKVASIARAHHVHAAAVALGGRATPWTRLGRLANLVPRQGVQPLGLLFAVDADANAGELVQEGAKVAGRGLGVHLRVARLRGCLGRCCCSPSNFLVHLLDVLLVRTKHRLVLSFARAVDAIEIVTAVTLYQLTL